MKMSQSPRVRYIWSQEFQDVSDQLPADPGRSSLVHVLIQTLNLLETEQNSLTGDKSENHVLDPISDDIETTTESSRLASSTRAVVVPPDPSLATGFSLRKYHDAAYVGSCSYLPIKADLLTISITSQNTC
jgi:hypothetical protein